MTDRTKRYDRVGRAFSALGEMNEVRLIQAQKRGMQIMDDISGIRSALASPVVEEMSIQVSAIRRLADLEDQRLRNAALVIELRAAMISAKSKEKHAKTMASELRVAGDRIALESESLEISGLMMNSRPRQGGDA